MWPEIAVGLLLMLMLQSLMLIGGWRSLRKLQLDLHTLVNSKVPRWADAQVARLERLDRRLARVEQQSPQPQSGVSYALARRLAREGADIEQLTSRCGLSRDEASLLLQLHRRAS
jgi:hypothetical protein